MPSPDAAAAGVRIPLPLALLALAGSVATRRLFPAQTPSPAFLLNTALEQGRGASATVGGAVGSASEARWHEPVSTSRESARKSFGNVRFCRLHQPTRRSRRELFQYIDIDDIEARVMEYEAELRQHRIVGRPVGVSLALVRAEAVLVEVGARREEAISSAGVERVPV